jgi:hypothetical protein
MAVVTGWLEISPMIGKIVRESHAGGCSDTSMGLAARMSTSIRTWLRDSAIRPNWNQSAASAVRRICGAWPGCWPSH